MSAAGVEVFKDDFGRRSSMKRVVNEFGNGCAKVGLIIAFAALIGRFLLESGAAAKIVLVMLSFFGGKARWIGVPDFRVPAGDPCFF